MLQSQVEQMVLSLSFLIQPHSAMITDLYYTSVCINLSVYPSICLKVLMGQSNKVGVSMLQTEGISFKFNRSVKSM